MDLKHIKFEVKQAKEEGLLEGWANVYTVDGKPFVDRHGDILVKGSLSHPEHVPVLIGHDANKPVGTAYLEERDQAGKTGIWAKIKLAIDADSPALASRAKEAFDLVKHGIMNKMSIGFRPLKESYEQIKGRVVRVISDIDMLEVSLTPTPASSESSVLMAKDATNITQLQARPHQKTSINRNEKVTPYVTGGEIVDAIQNLLLGNYKRANQYMESLLDRTEDMTGVRDFNFELAKHDNQCRNLLIKALDVSGMNPYVEELILDHLEISRLEKMTMAQ